MVESRRYNKIPGLSPVPGLGSPLGCFLISLSRRLIPPRLSDEHSTQTPNPGKLVAMNLRKLAGTNTPGGGTVLLICFVPLSAQKQKPWYTGLHVRPPAETIRYEALTHHCWGEASSSTQDHAVGVQLHEPIETATVNVCAEVIESRFYDTLILHAQGFSRWGLIVLKSRSLG